MNIKNVKIAKYFVKLIKIKIVFFFTFGTRWEKQLLAKKYEQEFWRDFKIKSHLLQYFDSVNLSRSAYWIDVFIIPDSENDQSQFFVSGQRNKV